MPTTTPSNSQSSHTQHHPASSHPKSAPSTTAPTTDAAPAESAAALAEEVAQLADAGLSEVEKLRRQLAALEAQAAAQETLRARESTLPVSFPDETDDLGTHARYADSDRVTVLHGYGVVESERVEWKIGRSNTMYKSIGGVTRDVAFSDAVHWRQQWGRKFVKILPASASEPDFARASGIQPMNLNKFAVMAEAVDVDALLDAWGQERALKFLERLTRRLAAKQQQPQQP